MSGRAYGGFHGLSHWTDGRPGLFPTFRVVHSRTDTSTAGPSSTGLFTGNRDSVSSGLGTGAIVGIAVGAAAIVIIYLVYMLLRRRNRRAQQFYERNAANAAAGAGGGPGAGAGGAVKMSSMGEKLGTIGDELDNDSKSVLSPPPPIGGGGGGGGARYAAGSSPSSSTGSLQHHTAVLMSNDPKMKGRA